VVERAVLKAISAQPLVQDLLCKRQGPQYVRAVCETLIGVEPKFLQKGEMTRRERWSRCRHALG